MGVSSRARALSLFLAGLVTVGCSPQASSPGSKNPNSSEQQPGSTASARSPDIKVIVTVREADKSMTAIKNANVSFESNSLNKQVTTDQDGKATLELPASPLLTADGKKKCAFYRITATAEAHQVEVLEYLYISPNGSSIFLDLPLIRGQGTWLRTEDGTKCDPDVRYGK